MNEVSLPFLILNGLVEHCIAQPHQADIPAREEVTFAARWNSKEAKCSKTVDRGNVFSDAIAIRVRAPSQSPTDGPIPLSPRPPGRGGSSIGPHRPR
jgi:hypothetical protein